MSALDSRSRKLTSFVKCRKCRQARQKCIRSNPSLKCDRCVRYKHSCDSGGVSDRAQRSQGQSSLHLPRNEQTLAVLGSTQHGSFSVYQLPQSDQETTGFSFEGTLSTEMSKTASSNCSTLLSTPNTQELLDFQDYDVVKYRNTSSAFLGISRTQVSEWFRTCSEFNADFDGYAIDTSVDDNAQQFFEASKSSDRRDSVLLPSQNSARIVATPASPICVSSGLTYLEPSRHRISSPKEMRLENRIVRLWDSDEAFASAKSGKSPVTPLFGRTFSKLFRESRQLAEYNEMVRETRYACGAADAWMNLTLSASTRAEYLKAYNRHDFKARILLWRAVHEFAESRRKGRSPDVVPLYIATFLHHAAGACIRGSIDVDAATAAFKYYNHFTKWFPIRLMRAPTSDGQWAVDMLLIDNDEDPGMRISSLMFALGRARLKFDREEGLC